MRKCSQLRERSKVRENSNLGRADVRVRNGEGEVGELAIFSEVEEVRRCAVDVILECENALLDTIRRAIATLVSWK